VTHKTIPSQKIYLLELLAAALGASSAAQKHSELFTDSQIALYALQKGHTNTVVGNKVLQFVLTHGTLSAVSWVPTTIQRADPITRGQRTPGPPVHLACRAANLRWRTAG